MVIPPIYVAAAGAMPALLAMWYFDRLDRKRPEPAGLRRLVALFGGLSVIPTLAYDGALLGILGDLKPPDSSYGGALFTAFIVAALIEEVMKVMIVYAVAWDRRSYDERMDAVVYGARAGLGFALVENVFYLLGQVELKGLIVTWILRAVLAVPGHALWTTIACAGATRQRFDKRPGLGVWSGLALAVLLHGTYDAGLFLTAPLAMDGQESLAYALLGVPLVVMIASWWIVKRYARTALRLDDEDAAKKLGGMAAAPGAAVPGAATAGAGAGLPPPIAPLPPAQVYRPYGYAPYPPYGYPPGYPWAGGWPHGHAPYAYPPGHPHAAQPHAVQPHVAQPHVAQPHVAQPHAVQPQAAQPQPAAPTVPPGDKPPDRT